MPENFDLSNILAGLDAKIVAKKGGHSTTEKPTSAPPITPEKPMNTGQQIAQKARELLDRWKGGPNGHPPERMGDIVQAYIKYGNENAGITPKNLNEWFPGYTKDDLRNLGMAMFIEARRRDEKLRKEGEQPFWGYIVGYEE